MSIKELIKKRRSIRKFRQEKIPLDTLISLIDVSRLSPSAANLQPWEFIVINEKNLCEEIFFTLSWAGYISPKRTPSEGERPVAYIAIIINKTINKDNYEHDCGAAAQNIMLSALEEGIGSCWLGAINREKIREILKLPKEYIIDTVIALGYPLEFPQIEEAKNNIKYYLDEEDKLHVPKRKLEDILHINKWQE